MFFGGQVLFEFTSFITLWVLLARYWLFYFKLRVIKFHTNKNWRTAIDPSNDEEQTNWFVQNITKYGNQRFVFKTIINISVVQTLIILLFKFFEFFYPSNESELLTITVTWSQYVIIYLIQVFFFFKLKFKYYYANFDDSLGIRQELLIATVIFAIMLVFELTLVVLSYMMANDLEWLIFLWLWLPMSIAHSYLFGLYPKHAFINLQKRKQKIQEKSRVKQKQQFQRRMSQSHSHSQSQSQSRIRAMHLNSMNSPRHEAPSSTQSPRKFSNNNLLNKLKKRSMSLTMETVGTESNGYESTHATVSNNGGAISNSQTAQGTPIAAPVTSKLTAVLEIPALGKTGNGTGNGTSNGDETSTIGAQIEPVEPSHSGQSQNEEQSTGKQEREKIGSGSTMIQVTRVDNKGKRTETQELTNYSPVQPSQNGGPILVPQISSQSDASSVNGTGGGGVGGGVNGGLIGAGFSILHFGTQSMVPAPLTSIHSMSSDDMSMGNGNGVNYNELRVGSPVLHFPRFGSFNSMNSSMAASDMNSTIRNENGIILSHKVGWRDIVQLYQGFEAFIKHLETEFSFENLLFILEYVQTKNILMYCFGNIMKQLGEEEHYASYHLKLPPHSNTNAKKHLNSNLNKSKDKKNGNNNNNNNNDNNDNNDNNGDDESNATDNTDSDLIQEIIIDEDVSVKEQTIPHSKIARELYEALANILNRYHDETNVKSKNTKKSKDKDKNSNTTATKQSQLQTTDTQNTTQNANENENEDANEDANVNSECSRTVVDAREICDVITVAFRKIYDKYIVANQAPFEVNVSSHQRFIVYELFDCRYYKKMQRDNNRSRASVGSHQLGQDSHNMANRLNKDRSMIDDEIDTYMMHIHTSSTGNYNETSNNDTSAEANTRVCLSREEERELYKWILLKIMICMEPSVFEITGLMNDSFSRFKSHNGLLIDSLCDKLQKMSGPK